MARRGIDNGVIFYSGPNHERVYGGSGPEFDSGPDHAHEFRGTPNYTAEFMRVQPFKRRW